MAKLSKISKFPTVDLNRLNTEIEKLKTGNYKNADDDKFWKLEVDKAGNGMAVIRFLPAAASDGDILPWVQYFDHGFKGPSGQWYIENSLTTLNKKDPASEYNNKLWNATSDDQSPLRKQARDQKRRLHYVAPILVVKDPKHPENNGKVFLFKYGKKIADKLSLASNPTFEGDTPINPYDMGPGGANFILRRRNVAGYPNYDESTWETPSAVSDDEEEVNRIYGDVPSLKDIVSPDKFKSYDELLERLANALGISVSHLTDILSGEVSVTAGPARAKTARKETRVVEEEEEVDVDDPPFNVDDDDEELQSFKSLV